MCQLQDFSDLEIVDPWKRCLEKELPLWHSQYLPVTNTVLDLGAGCGETARLFLNHGAKRVVCVEADPIALSHLRANYGNDERVMIIPETVGGIKVDIEGSEWGMSIETHNGYPGFKPVSRYVRYHGHAGWNVWKLEPRREPFTQLVRYFGKRAIVRFGALRRGL